MEQVKKMKKLLVASNNDHKVKEIREMLGKYPFEIISLKDAGIGIDVEEDGKTFMENAEKKAEEIFKSYNNYMVLADDSGLMVDSLGGAPGVYSARFAGEHGNSLKNNMKLLSLLKGKKMEERKAKFVCAMVLIVNKDKIIKVQGEVHGYITEDENGQNGFGYDPLFYVPEFKKTFAQMSSNDKNSISHRAIALAKLEKELKSILQEDLNCL